VFQDLKFDIKKMLEKKNWRSWCLIPGSAAGAAALK
jgi:hypothetical protein